METELTDCDSKWDKVYACLSILSNIGGPPPSHLSLFSHNIAYPGKYGFCMYQLKRKSLYDSLGILISMEMHPICHPLYS